MIGELERVGLREVRPHEAQDFTLWLEDNIGVLNDVLDLTLTNPESEQSAGRFSVDLVAEDQNGNPAMIENQLGKNDRDHLGKLITYLVGVEANTAIWIVSDARPEHLSSVVWLNESSAADFFLLRFEAVKIGKSSPAPLLTLIVGPSEEVRDVGKTKERYIIRRRLWTQLLGPARDRSKLHANASPSQHGAVSTGIGKRGLGFAYVIGQHEAREELYINTGRNRDDENEQVLD